MPTPPNTAPAEFDFVASAHEAHRSAGYDFPAIFDAFFKGHVVLKNPDIFALVCADFHRPDAWLIWWWEARPGTHLRRRELAAQILACVPYYRPFFSWARGLKNQGPVKYYSTERLARFTSDGRKTHAL
jgi:hypothetical protein